jgi:integron integrase
MDQPKLSQQLYGAVMVRNYSQKTFQTYWRWVREFILFHDTRHPVEMGAAEISRFLNHLVTVRRLSPTTVRQARCAIVFLYRHVLGREPGEFREVPNPKRNRRLPTVLSQDEVGRLLPCLEGRYRLMGGLLYGSGLRLRECLKLRVKDIDFDRHTVSVRDGKGGKDRTVPLSKALGDDLQAHLREVWKIHQRDLKNGLGAVDLPHALHRKYPKAPRLWVWQYVFPADRLSTDPKTGRRGRWHVYDTTLQRAVKTASRKSGIQKRITCHTLRHSFATHMVENGYDIRTIQTLLGHKSLDTTMIYVHIVEAGRGVSSPLDRITLPRTRLYGECIQDDVGKSGNQSIGCGRKP